MAFYAGSVVESKGKVNLRAIVAMKVISACMLFFCGCLFFLEFYKVLIEDTLNLNPLPLLFLVGIILVSTYITFLIGHIESKDLYLVDRYDTAYKVVFTLTVLAMVLRGLFSSPYLYVPVPIMVIGILSGIITILTPRVVDNDNDEF